MKPVVAQHANELNVNVNNKLMSIILNNCHTTSVQRPVQRQGLCDVWQGYCLSYLPHLEYYISDYLDH